MKSDILKTYKVTGRQLGLKRIIPPAKSPGQVLVWVEKGQSVYVRKENK